MLTMGALFIYVWMSFLFFNALTLLASIWIRQGSLC